MKILMLNHNLKGVGTYQRCFYFSRELARAGCHVTMMTVSQQSKYRPRAYYKKDWIGEFAEPSGHGPWVKMIEGPYLGHTWLLGWRSSGPLDIGLRIQTIWKEGFDAVYGFEYLPNVGLPVYLTRPFYQYRFFSDWCDWYAGGANPFKGWGWVYPIDRYFEEHIRLRAEKVTVISQTLRERAKSIGVKESNIIHIPQGGDTDYCGELSKLEMRNHLGFPEDSFIVLAARKEVDMEREIQIFQKILEQLPNCMFIVVGNVIKSAYQFAEKLGISRSIHWTGWVSDEDYPRYLACADVFIFPTNADNINLHACFPGKILDYLSIGRPLVTNDIGEIGLRLRNRDVCELVPPDDQNLAESVIALSKDEERRKFLGENARRIMLEEWDWKIIGKQILQVVEA